MGNLYLLEARIFIAMVLGGIATPILVLLINSLIMPFLKDKAIIKARKDGHVVEARLIKKVNGSVNESMEEMRRVYATYEYEYNGRKYKQREYYIDYAPETKTMYFKRNPKKAKEISQFGYVESKLPVFLMASAIAFVCGLFVL